MSSRFSENHGCWPVSPMSHVIVKKKCLQMTHVNSSHKFMNRSFGILIAIGVPNKDPIIWARNAGIPAYLELYEDFSAPRQSSKFSIHPASSMFLSILQSQRLPSSCNDSMQAGTTHIYLYGGVGSWFVVFSSSGTSAAFGLHQKETPWIKTGKSTKGTGMLLEK